MSLALSAVSTRKYLRGNTGKLRLYAGKIRALKP
uniref:Uncharacterized protein n=1 Tax=Anguilla anguilla TaxID=7936 RepID=A0A0E9RQS5_ANGAN